MSASCCARTCVIPQEIGAAHEPESLWKNTKGLSERLQSRHTLIPQPIFSSEHLFHGFTFHDSVVDQTSCDVFVYYCTIRLCEWSQSQLVLSLPLKVFYISVSIFDRQPIWAFCPNVTSHYWILQLTETWPVCKIDFIFDFFHTSNLFEIMPTQELLAPSVYCGNFFRRDSHWVAKALRTHSSWKWVSEAIFVKE